MARYPTGKIPRSSKEYGKTFICRRGCNTRTATYTEEFIWEDVFRGTEVDVHKLIDKIQNETKVTRKKRREQRTRRDSDIDMMDDSEGERTTTPQKRRRKAIVGTPQKPRTPIKLLTPSHKR
jgi:origin recognition complex subunit 1